MSFQKKVSTAFIVLMVALFLIVIISCNSLGGIFTTNSDPASRRVGFGIANADGKSLDMHFDRIKSGSGNQFFFEFNYSGDVGPELDTLLLNIDNGGQISIKGQAVSRMPNIITKQIDEITRFPVSNEICNQLLNCNGITWKLTAKYPIPEYFRDGQPNVKTADVGKIKEFINYWNNSVTVVDGAK